MSEPDTCAAVTDPGRRYGEPAEPPEYCENPAEEGSELCAIHQLIEEGR